MDNYPTGIEEATAECWLATGAITVASYGSENTYYVDQFEQEFYCKNYPQKYMDENGIVFCTLTNTRLTKEI